MVERPCNVVTGANGFVGLYLVEALARAQIPVVGLGILSSAGHPSQRLGGFALADAERPCRETL